MDVQIVEKTDASGRPAFFLEHDFDIMSFDGLPGHGPFSSAAEAEQNAEALSAILGGTSG